MSVARKRAVYEQLSGAGHAPNRRLTTTPASQRQALSRRVGDERHHWMLSTTGWLMAFSVFCDALQSAAGKG
jgi:hypothetical protein